MSAPRFPALVTHRASGELPMQAHLDRIRARHRERLHRAQHLLDRATHTSAETATAAVRHFVVAAHQLATLERCACRCDASEAVLSNALSRLLAMARDRELTPALRIAAARGAEPCAEDLAMLYDDHELHAHAQCVRKTIVFAQETAKHAMS